MHYKVKVDGKVESRALYNMLVSIKEGRKEIIGMYISESEGTKFWLSVLTNLQNRGLKGILTACIDNLNGFSEPIISIFPKAEV
ncbi:MAG: putative transposase [Psychromonas sp.]|jgi:putative transposase